MFFKDQDTGLMKGHAEEGARPGRRRVGLDDERYGGYNVLVQ